MVEEPEVEEEEQHQGQEAELDEDDEEEVTPSRMGKPSKFLPQQAFKVSCMSLVCLSLHKTSSLHTNSHCQICNNIPRTPLKICSKLYFQEVFNPPPYNNYNFARA